MTVILKTSNNLAMVENRINTIMTKYSKELPEIGFEYAKLAQRNLRLQLTRNGNIWRRKTWQSIKAIRETKDRSVVKIRREGIFLDSMKPHYVKLKRGRLIHKWALQKGNDNVKKIAKREGSIFVKPHPFIDEALARTQINLPKIIKRKLAKINK